MAVNVPHCGDSPSASLLAPSPHTDVASISNFQSVLGVFICNTKTTMRHGITNTNSKVPNFQGLSFGRLCSHFSVEIHADLLKGNQ